MPKDNMGSYSTFVSRTGTAVASAATGAAPTSDNGVGALGVDISDATGFRAIVSADSGQTLSGGGNVRIWLYSTSLKRWVHNSQLDYPMSTVTAATYRDDSSPDFPISMGYGRVYVQLDAVTVSSGNATPTVEAGRAVA